MQCNALARELIEMERYDRLTRERLVVDGALFDGYAPEMERVHLANAERLETILDEHGWPGVSLVGPEASAAAWIVAQHAISRPAFQRRCLAALREAVAAGEAAPAHEAHLVDRIAYFEGRPQRFGTSFDWDADGRLSPCPVHAPETVDARRVSAGLPPLADAVRKARAEAQAEGQRPPADLADRRREFEAWAQRVGWRPATTDDPTGADDDAPSADD